MATKISDLVIVPEQFHDYVSKLILERSQFVQSGFVQNVPSFIPSKGKITNAPSFLAFQGDDEVLSDSGALTVNKVNSLNALAAINFRGKAFGTNDLVGQLSGADPLGNLASKFADYWVRMLNRTTLQTALGATAGLDAAYGAGSIIMDASMSTISADMVIDTKQLAGEYADQLGIMICHSAVKSQLQKNDLTKDVVVDSVGTAVTTFQGMRVVIDDMLAPVGGVYTTLFAAPGSMVYAEGIDPSLSIETDRDILAGDDIVTSRKRFIVHPNGATFTGAPAGVSATNAELGSAGSWGAEDPTDAKRIPWRALQHLVA